MSKRVEVKGLNIDTNMNADDFNHHIVTCIKNCSNSVNVVNLIKVKVGESCKAYDLEKLLTLINDAFKEQGLTNCVFVPIKKGFIEDITVDYVKVFDDETN